MNNSNHKNRRHIIIYICGPYTGSDYCEISQNILNAEKAARQIWGLGFTVICQHLNTAHFDEGQIPGLSYEDFIEGSLRILQMCNGLFVLPGSENSKGAQIEIEFAKKHNIPIFTTLDELLEYYQGS